MASIAKLAPAVEPLEGVFKSAVSHHCALRTSNIGRAMKFYSLLGMNEVRPFVLSRVMVWYSTAVAVLHCLSSYEASQKMSCDNGLEESSWLCGIT